MDLYPIAQEALTVVATAAVPSVLALVTWGMRQAQAKWHFQVSQDAQAQINDDITAVVETGVGLGRAKLASGQMSLEHVVLNNPHVDQIAQAMLNMLSAEAKASGITTDDIARRIVAGIGHALGDDPSVPSIAAPAAPQPQKLTGQDTGSQGLPVKSVAAVPGQGDSSSGNPGSKSVPVLVTGAPT